MSPKLIRCFILALLLSLTANLVLAQTGTISYGQAVQGVIDEKSPQVVYTFTGAAGDLITAYLVGTSSRIRPTLVLLGTNGQLAFSDGDLLTPIPDDATITHRLPQDGTYTLLVSSLPDTSGTYSLSLVKSDAGPSTELQMGPPLQVNIPVGGSPKVFRIKPQPDIPTIISVRAEQAAPFVARLRDSAGNLMAVVSSPLLSADLLVPPGQDAYDLTVESAGPEVASAVTLEVNVLGPPPPGTENASEGPPPGVCSATPASGDRPLNIRSGPSTQFGVVGQLQPGGYLAVLGQRGLWYAVEYNGERGWIGKAVVRLEGPCENLPVILP